MFHYEDGDILLVYSSDLDTHSVIGVCDKLGYVYFLIKAVPATMRLLLSPGDAHLVQKHYNTLYYTK